MRIEEMLCIDVKSSIDNRYLNTISLYFDKKYYNCAKFSLRIWVNNFKDGRGVDLILEDVWLTYYDKPLVYKSTRSHQSLIREYYEQFRSTIISLVLKALDKAKQNHRNRIKRQRYRFIYGKSYRQAIEKRWEVRQLSKELIVNTTTKKKVSKI